MAAVNAAGRDWSIGSALTAAGSVLAGHFVPFVATALVAGLPKVAVWLTIGVSTRGILTTVGIVTMIANIIGVIFVIQTLVYGSVQALRGRQVSIGDCLMQGLRRLPVGLGVGFLSYLGMVLGMILLIIPGVILALMWSVALPAATVERTGVLASLSRSSALTRGRRWRILGAVLIPLLMASVISWILIGIFGGLREIGSPGYQIASWVLQAIVQAFNVCVFATLYYYLRREKEGVDIEQVAAVFD